MEPTDPGPVPHQEASPQRSAEEPVDAIDPHTAALEAKILSLQEQGRRGANWFYWVAGLSLVNSLLTHLGGNIRFVVGMGVSSAADSIAAIGAKEHPAQAAIFRAMAIAFAVLASAIVVLFGWLANRRYIAFFAIGMVLYLLDGLLLLLFRQWLSVGFHAFVLFCMFGGLMAYRQLNQIEETLGHRAARRSLSHRDEGFDAESQKNY
jgi:hypothetical protein